MAEETKKNGYVWTSDNTNAAIEAGAGIVTGIFGLFDGSNKKPESSSTYTGATGGGNNGAYYWGLPPATNAPEQPRSGTTVNNSIPGWVWIFLAIFLVLALFGFIYFRSRK